MDGASNDCAFSSFSPEDFKIHRLLNKGKSTGSFLYDVSFKDKRFALKHVIARSSVDLRNAQRERDVLIHIRSCIANKGRRNRSIGGSGYRFMIRIHRAFQSSSVDLHQLMTLAVGGDLFEQRLLRPNLVFPEEEARFYLAELICALRFLHVTCNVIHRDIKTENILLDRHGHVLLGDFNLARRLPWGKTLTNEVGGTFEYLAPESAPPKCSTSYASDIYSVGMLALELVLGVCRVIPSDASEEKIFEIITRGEREHSEGRTSDEFTRFINCLASDEPFCRPSVSELVQLPFFGTSCRWDAMDWDALIHRQIRPPRLLKKSEESIPDSVFVNWNSAEDSNFKGEILKNFHFEVPDE